MKTTADEVFPPAWSEFQQALQPISPERLAELRKTAGGDVNQLMGVAILAQGELSQEIQRDCIERFPETAKYFLAHELNQLQMEDMSGDKVKSMARRILSANCLEST